MFQRRRFTKFLVISLAVHAAVIGAALLLIVRTGPVTPPSVHPVQIVDLPPDLLRKPPVLPPQPSERPTVRPAPLPPPPRKFGTAPEESAPGKHPGAGLPEATGKQGAGGGKAAVPAGKGPLPFLSQRDIDELARRGMPDQKPGDDSVTLDTNEFKFISYNRWLKIKVESVLKYPELAAVSGLQGTLYIQFDIMKDGSLGNLELLKSSGYKILDDEALRAIRSSAPFQPLPDEWHMDHYAIRAAVLFYLSGAYIR